MRKYTKKDFIILLCCAVFLLMNIGAIGSGSRKRAKELICLSNLRQWGVIFEMYTEDNDGYFNEGWGVGETTLWPNALRPYYKDNWEMLLCPTATRIMENNNDWGTFNAPYRDLALPGGGQYRYVFSYGINSWTNYMHAARGDRPEEWFWKNTHNLTDIQSKPVSSNHIPIFGDAIWHDAWPRHTDTPALNVDTFGIISGEMNHFCINRHNGFINMLFMDWSTRNVGLKELWTLKWSRGYEVNGPWTITGSVWPTDWPPWMRNFKDF